MSVRFYSPDCLQADCFLIVIKDEKSGIVKNILIDGGDRRVFRFNILKFLKKHEVSQIDFLIVTHLHRDHIGRLDKVSEKYPVKKAQLVYSEKDLEGLTWDKVYSSEMRTDLMIYRKLLFNLKKQNAEISYSFDTNGKAEGENAFDFLNYRFEKIFPLKKRNDRSFVLPLIKKINSKESYDFMRNWINKDSSVWILKNNEKNLVLFSGDSFEENMKNPPEAEILKLTHHGRNSDFATYFSKEQISKVNPSKIIVTTTKKLFKKLKKDPERNFIFNYKVLCPSIEKKEIKIEFD